MKRYLHYLRYPALALAACGLYLLFLQCSGNFHEAVEGELYRSAQLRPGDIPVYVKKYHIRSVLNLRGGNPGEDWYDTEVAEAKMAGVEHLDYRMKASRELSKEQVLALLDIMRNAPKPLLIHCRGGADRTGLASAFYLAAIAKKGEWAAERQLWLTYGHLPLWVNSTFAMNRTFEAMEPYLGFPNS